MQEKMLIEAALFMSPKPLAIQELMQVAQIQNYAEAKRIAFEFVREFNARNSALEITEADGLLQMRVKPQYDAAVEQFASKSLFHKGIMKTLALIAFKQPIMQSAVVKYRNNKAYDHISRLVLEGFIARENKGRSYVLRTTQKFVEYFGEDAFKKQQ